MNATINNNTAANQNIYPRFEEVYGHKLTLKELAEGYVKDEDTGATTSMNGMLDVHPSYQREFIYGKDKMEEVIYTILENAPLGAIYFATNGDKLEVMDGQQRVTSICKFMRNEFSVNISTGIGAKEISRKNYSSLSPEQRELFDNYSNFDIHICAGTREQKMMYFRRINKAGLVLTEQEIRNANYDSEWVTAAKTYFSRNKGLAVSQKLDNTRIFLDYSDAVVSNDREKTNAVARQYLLETALKWASDAENDERAALAKDAKVDIDGYMGNHRLDSDKARKLWRYYEDVINWVYETFPTYNTKMKGVEWGYLYNRYKDVSTDDLDEKADKLLSDEVDIGVSAGKVYEAVLCGNMKLIEARKFQDRDKKKKYKEQGGACAYCKKIFKLDEMDGDHKIPWSKGGKTEYENLQMLCKKCNIRKSDWDETNFIDPFNEALEYEAPSIDYIVND